LFMKLFIGCIVTLLFIVSSINLYAATEDLLIVFSGEELGSLEPCGCFEGQIGGISRRDSLLDLLSGKKDVILPVSLGDLSKSAGRQDDIKMEILCRALGDMDYVTHNLGEKDIETDPQLISYLSQTSKFVFLSSNIQFTTPFPIKINPYVLKECMVSGHTIKVAFLGILSKALFNNHASDAVTVSEPVQALKPLVNELKKKASLLVLLSHSPIEESAEIAKSFPEIDLIITGHSIEEPDGSVVYVNSTLIVSPGKQGKYVGVVKYSTHNMGIKRKSVELVPLDNKYRDSQEMISLLKEYQQIVLDEDLLGNVSQIPLLDNVSYVGSAVCGLCHKVVHNHWSKTKHGVAYNTLVSKGYQYDPECIKCHTTGYGYVSGFVNYDENNNLINTGCESCHGAGSPHIQHVTEPYGVTDEHDCMVCHDAEHSPKFQFNEYWRKIEHPEETLSGIPKTPE